MTKTLKQLCEAIEAGYAADVLRLLVLAGHVPQEKVDQALELARDFKRADGVPAPGVPFKATLLFNGENRVVEGVIRADARGVKVSEPVGEALFRAEHEFLEWNRAQREPLVKIAYEYGVARKAVELYLAAVADVKAVALSDKDIERIAGRDELSGDAILDFGRRLLEAAAGVVGAVRQGLPENTPNSLTSADGVKGPDHG